MSTNRDGSHAWRYANRPYPAPDGIRMSVRYVGGSSSSVSYEGRTFFKLTDSHLLVIDPANGGYPVSAIERGLIRRLEIEAK